MIGYGIDVSHWQTPSALPWESQFRGHVDFVIARAGYGSKGDRHCVEHVRRARLIGAKVGLYTFFRPTESVSDQWDILRAAAEAVWLTDGDIVPALDIERDPLPKPGQDVSPSWSGPCEEFVGRIVEEYGDAIVYITQREWGFLGRPEWVLHRPLWCAHYTGAAKPATPGGMPATIWQHRVGPFVPCGAGGYDKERPELDQNRLLRPLPLVGNRLTDEDRERVMEMVALNLADEAREAAAQTDPAPAPEECV